jgi:small subunit ribosomal protein S20
VGTLSAAKRQRQNEKRRIRNRSAKSTVRTAQRRFETAVKEKNVEAADAAFQRAASLLDSAARKGVFHRNTAARTKSRMQRKLNQLKVE